MEGLSLLLFILVIVFGVTGLVLTAAGFGLLGYVLGRVKREE